MLYKGIVGKKVLFIKCNIYTLYITNHQLSYNTVSLCVCVCTFFTEIQTSAAQLDLWRPDYMITILVWSLEMIWRRRILAREFKINPVIRNRGILTKIWLADFPLIFSEGCFLPLWMSRNVWPTERSLTMIIWSIKTCRPSLMALIETWLIWTENWPDCQRAVHSSW